MRIEFKIVFVFFYIYFIIEIVSIPLISLLHSVEIEMVFRLFSVVQIFVKLIICSMSRTICNCLRILNSFLNWFVSTFDCFFPSISYSFVICLQQYFASIRKLKKNKRSRFNIQHLRCKMLLAVSSHSNIKDRKITKNHLLHYKISHN